MNDPHSNRTGPPRAPAPPARTRRPPVAALTALALCLGLPTADVGAESAGVKMRRARFALARGADGDAAIDLEAVRQSEPGSSRSLEAAMLLADLRFSTGRARDAEAILADAAEAAPGDLAAPIILTRGWLALRRGATGEAREHFAGIRSSGVARARAVAEIGTCWASLAANEPVTDVAALVSLAHGDGPLAMRFAAGWTLAEAYASTGDHRRALRELRRLRRDVRRTSFEDDLELMLGLAQLEAGRARDARRTFTRLERRHGPGSSRSPVDTGLRLADLQAPMAEFVARVGALYAGRATRSVGLMPFLAALLDRHAALDARAATALAQRALDAKKGGGR